MKKIFFSMATICLTFVLLLTTSEILLRKIKGIQPWKYRSKNLNEPTMLVYHPVLGWTSKKGYYFIPRYKPEGKDIHMTFISDGVRDTGRTCINTACKGELVIVGCSFTQGWAISDNETYPWKLQDKFPSVKVVNYGVAAYSTYQSLLVLERELPRMKMPLIVLYGFLDDHEMRNVAPLHWLETLEKNSTRGHVHVPYVTLDNTGELVRHPSERYPETPLREYLSTITYIERLFVKFKTMGRETQARQVTEKLILEMKKVSEKFGAKFVVVILWSTDFKQDYINLFKKNNIQFIDCSHRLTPDMRVPGEGHPNEKLNSLWAECISNSVNRYIEP